MQSDFIINKFKESNKIYDKKTSQLLLRQVDMEKNLIEILDSKEMCSHWNLKILQLVIHIKSGICELDNVIEEFMHNAAQIEKE